MTERYPFLPQIAPAMGEKEHLAPYREEGAPDYVRFAQEEQERRKETPVYVDSEDIAERNRQRTHTLIVDPKLGFLNHTFHFWINRLPAGGEDSQHWKTLGHRHAVEAIILWLSGSGYSIIDGIRYDWTAGDFICVPFFAWHRHVNKSNEWAYYCAATTSSLAFALGQAVYEDERYPEFWVHAQEGGEALKTLVPGGSRTVSGLDAVQQFAARPDDGRGQPSAPTLAPSGLPSAGSGHLTAGHLYAQQVAFAAEEERRRRQGRVQVRGSDLLFEPTAMGSVAYVVDPRIGFHVKALATLVGQVPPGKRSGAHRHLYEEVDYILAGRGECIVEDHTYKIKPGDALAIPVFAWHQYFCGGEEPLQILAHTSRPALENLGYELTQQGELANY